MSYISISQSFDDVKLSMHEISFDSISLKVGDTLSLGLPANGAEKYQCVSWYSKSGLKKKWPDTNALLVLDHFRKDDSGNTYPVFHGFLYEFYGEYKEADIWPTQVYAIIEKALETGELKLGYKKL